MYFDSGLSPDFNDPEIMGDLLASLPFFGIRGAFINCTKDTLPLVQDLKDQFPRLQLYSRATVRAETLDALKIGYRRCQGKFDLVSVQSSNEEVLNFAARDSRFHILSLCTRSEWAALKPGTASLAAQFTTGIEFPLSFLLKSSESTSLHIRMCRKALGIARAAHAPILLSSFARTKYDLFGGAEIRVLASAVLGLPLPTCRKIVAEYPQAIVARNPRTRPAGEIMEGVRIVPNSSEGEPPQ